MSSDKFITCGAIESGAGLDDIVVNEKTGDAVVISDLQGNRYLTGFKVEHPILCTDETNFQKLIDYFNCDGVILSQEYLITLKDYTASYRDYVDKQKIVLTVDYDDFCQSNDDLSDID